MKAIRTNQTTSILGAGENENCNDLPIRRAGGMVDSHWIMTDADLEALVENGGIVTLSVRGTLTRP